MFENLTEKFSRLFKKIRGQSRLSEANVDDILKEIKLSLLEADVNYKVVKDFINEIKNKIIGTEVIDKLNPSEMVVKIVREELINLFSASSNELKISSKLDIYMFVGLQGSGKTTNAAKLANYLTKKKDRKVLLCACDVYRPAAIEQLKQLGKQINVEVFSLGTDENPVDIAYKAKEKCLKEGFNTLIVDTAGRLQIDDKLMEELTLMKKKIVPDEVLLLVDAMAGQDSVNVAKEFNEKVGVTGVILSKLDGDARGGAALSIAKVANVGIKFIGVGEKIDDLDQFYPDRMAERILGMGDILTLVDKVQENIDEKEMAKSARKMEDGNFTLLDLLDQMKQVQKMGSLGGLMKLIPGMPKVSDEQLEAAEKEMKNFEVIINSMTPYERNHPEVLKNSRKIRIAKGSGKTSADINRVLKKYEQSKMMMKQLNQYKKSGKMPPFPPMGGKF